MRALIIMAALAASLANAGCQTQGDPSVTGTCNLIAPPGKQICGQTKEDQHWIDVAITRYGAACHWEKHPEKPCVRISVDPKLATPKERKLLDRLLHREPRS